MVVLQGWYQKAIWQLINVIQKVRGVFLSAMLHMTFNKEPFTSIIIISKTIHQSDLGLNVELLTYLK